MEKISGQEPAQPAKVFVDGGGGYVRHYGSSETELQYEGLSIRQHFAGLAMNGMLATCKGYDITDVDNLAKVAVAMADALIKQLNK